MKSPREIESPENRLAVHTSDNEFEQLRELLVGIDRLRANDTIERVSDLQRRGEDVRQVLLDAIRQLPERDRRQIIDALAADAEKALQQTIRDDPERVSSLIYPIMLPAIRKAVADTMRSSMEKMDELYKTRLSPGSIKWRVDAMRSGIPYKQYLLRKSLQFDIEHVFLIDPDTGLLMHHASASEELRKDEDAISSMLVAIERFVNDSFNEQDEELQRVTIGSKLMYIVHNPEAMLVCVVKGSPPAALLPRLQELLDQLSRRHEPALKAFVGDRDALLELTPDVEQCLQLNVDQLLEEEGRVAQKTASTWIKWGAVLLLTIVLLTLVQMWRNFQMNNFAEALDADPHIRVFGIERDGLKYRINGIYDPGRVVLPVYEGNFLLRPSQIVVDLVPVDIISPTQEGT